MDAMARLNQAMRYIEQNLAEELDFTRVERIAGCSEYHFRRMFSYIAGMSLTEYVRRRRLTLAGVDLRAGREKIIDIAMRYGYDSPDAFTRAFAAMHGVSPSRARSEPVDLAFFPPITFRLTVGGGMEMQYRIVEKGAFFIMGARGRIPLIYSGPNPHTADVWKKLNQEKLLHLVGVSKMEPTGIITAYTNYEDKQTEGTELDYYVGIVTDAPLPERYETLPVPASTWAVFTAVGAHGTSTQQVWARIYDTWFPSSGYEILPGPEMLWYEIYDFQKPDLKTEIWVPVRKTE